MFTAWLAATFQKRLPRRRLWQTRRKPRVAPHPLRLEILEDRAIPTVSPTPSWEPPPLSSLPVGTTRPTLVNDHGTLVYAAYVAADPGWRLVEYSFVYVPPPAVTPADTVAEPDGPPEYDRPATPDTVTSGSGPTQPRPSAPPPPTRTADSPAGGTARAVEAPVAAPAPAVAAFRPAAPADAAGFAAVVGGPAVATPAAPSGRVESSAPFLPGRADATPFAGATPRAADRLAPPAADADAGWSQPTPAAGTDTPPPAAPGAGLAGLPDGVLLRRFAAGREQAAFTELVRRYGDSVTAACSRVLGDPDLARDASQAAFLALARRAAGLDARGSLAGWLYKVAVRLAVRLRAAAARRRRLEQFAAGHLPRAAADETAAVERAEVWRVLREELGRLPDEYRVPLVLCYLDGRTHAEVARAVGLPRGSVAKRLREGLRRLRDRLDGRGILSPGEV